MLLKDSTRNRQNLQPQRVFSSSPHSPAAQQMQTQVGISPFLHKSRNLEEFRFYSSSRTHLWDMNLCPLKFKALQWEQDVEGVWNPSFLWDSALGYWWIFPIFPPQHPNLGVVVPNSTETGWSPHLGLLSLATGPGLEVPFHCGPSLGQERGPTNCYYFPIA